MLSARSIARAAPRALGRLNAAVAIRSSQAARAGTVLKTFGASFTPSRAPSSFAASFSSSAARRAADGETDDELSAKLDSEILIEEEMKATEQQPASVKDFLENSPFELVDTPGQEVVKLVRDFGEEKITVSFSIADITNFDPYSEDAALADEADEDVLAGSNEQSAGSNSRSSAAAEEDEMDDEMDDETAAPINLSILVEKPGKTAGALSIDATAQDGNIVVENMFYFEDAKLARVETPEAAQRRAEVYPGPPFGSLDDDLQVLMERFLEERGITQAMAVFVPDYVDVKEQQEYLRWLNNVKTFIDA